MPRRTSQLDERKLDRLIGGLLYEIAVLLKKILAAANASEQPNASIAGVVDAITNIQIFAAQRGRR